MRFLSKGMNNWPSSAEPAEEADSLPTHGQGQTCSPTQVIYYQILQNFTPSSSHKLFVKKFAMYAKIIQKPGITDVQNYYKFTTKFSTTNYMETVPDSSQDSVGPNLGGKRRQILPN